MIGVTKTFIPPPEIFSKYLQQIWASGWITSNGKLVQELSKTMQNYLGAPFLNLVSSGTLGLQIGIKALDLEEEIITTAFSYVATTSSMAWLSVKPVFVDIDPSSLNIDVNKIEAAIRPKTKGILATHLFGNPCDVEAIQEIANRYNLRVIYDAAPAFGVKYQGKSLLNYGDLAVLSLHATKVFHTAEGGAIISHQKSISDKIFQLANFGHKGDDQGFHGLGINGKLSELHAAMGLSVLPYVQEIIKKRQQITRFYDHKLEGCSEFRKQALRPDTNYNYAYYPLIFKSENQAVVVKTKLLEQGFQARRYFYPALSTLPYVTTNPMPIAEDIASRILCLPLSHELNKVQTELITDIVLQIVR